jgi:hypothetical protein
MAATVSSILEHQVYSGMGQPSRRRITGKANLGNPYAINGILLGLVAIQAALDTALGRTDVGLTTIHSLLVGNSSDPNYLFSYVSATGKVKCHIKPAVSLNAGALPVLTPNVAGVFTPNVPASVAWSAELTTAAHVATIPAGTFALAVEATEGLTAPCMIQYTAAGATKEVCYDPAARTLTFLAADSCTKCRVLLLTPGVAASFAPGAASSLAAGTLPTVNVTGLAAEAGAVDLSTITFDFEAIVS